MLSTFEREIGSRTLALETGRLAQQANGSVLVSYGDSVVLVTATMSKPREGIDFFPLTIDMEERLYARGKIPGSFFRREGRPSTDAILTDRLTDRALRPLFPDGFKNEVQVIVTPLSTDLENPLDLPAMIGASTALSISDIPFEGPLGSTRVGYIDGEFVINPTYQQLEESKLDLVVAGTRDGVMMMEAGVNELTEDLVLEGMRRGQEVNLELIDLQDEIVRSVGRAKAAFEASTIPDDLTAKVASSLDGKLAGALGSEEQNSGRLEELKARLLETLGEDYRAADIVDGFESYVETYEKKEFQGSVLERGERPDGRGLKEIRPVSCEVGLLPRTHGSGLFTRGETQILGIATLGGPGDAQRLDNMSPQESKRFMLHYNFPPFSTGETKRIMSPGRREIGHGALAERAISPVLPDEDEFPYTIRVVAEALSSNGSTSMASVCAGILALMDAGVPIKKPVAGISIGLVKDDNGRFATLTDIQGLEDHVGGMDFKVAGTREGITAIQLDIKVKSIGFDIIETALAQAKEARTFILDRMQETIETSRAEMSPYAPRMTRITVPVDKIGAVIGPGGKTIRGITEETGATVDVEDDGSVTIGAIDQAAAQKAIDMIKGLTREAKVGEIFAGKVVRILNFGAFVELFPGTDGLVHISELSNERVPTVEDVVNLGEEITVIVKDVDPTGKVSLSRRMLLEGGSPRSDGDPPARTSDRPRGGPRPGDGRPRDGGRPGGGDRGGYRPTGGRRGGQRPGPRSSGPRPQR